MEYHGIDYNDKTYKSIYIHIQFNKIILVIKDFNNKFL